MSWNDSGYWDFWIYRLFIGYAPDGEKEDFHQAWEEADGGSLFWCGQIGTKIFSIGWAMPGSEETTTETPTVSDPSGTEPLPQKLQ